MSIIGWVDKFSGADEMSGWACDTDRPPDYRVSVVVRLRGQDIARALADIYRPDLMPYGDGRYGWKLALPPTVSLHDLASESFEVLGEDGAGAVGRLPVIAEIRDAALLAAASASISAALCELGERQIEDRLRRALAVLRPSERVALVSAATYFRNPVLAHRSEARRSRQDDGTSRPSAGLSGFLPIGTVSADGSAIVGGDGNLFLIGGSNEILAQYAVVDPPHAGTANGAEWVDLIRARARRLAASGVRCDGGLPPRYVQIIIPDKISVLDKHCPVQVETPTPPLRTIEERLRVDGDYLPLLAALRTASEGARIFRQVDTHLTAQGAFLVFQAIVDHLGLTLPASPSFDVVHPLTGDLDTRFFGSSLYEDVLYADPEAVAAVSGEPVLVSEIDATAHNGYCCHWHNQRAPFPLKVLVFGNSFFAWNDTAQWLISWWMARHFRDYVFIWTSEMIDEDILHHQPDIVICQTVERFLPQLPDR